MKKGKKTNKQNKTKTKQKNLNAKKSLDWEPRNTGHRANRGLVVVSRRPCCDGRLARGGRIEDRRVVNRLPRRCARGQK